MKLEFLDLLSGKKKDPQVSNFMKIHSAEDEFHADRQAWRS
jgi:hypothetical protein